MLTKVRLLIHEIAGLVYKLIVKLKVKDTGKSLRVNGYCKLSRNTHLGNNVNLNGMEILGSGHIYIGDNFHSGAGCLVISSIHNYDSGTKIPYDETVITKDVHIKNNVWLGARVIVLGGVTIEEGAIIQAGAVVVSDVAKCSIVGGNPARAFKTRNLDHYEKLKEEGLFF